MTAMPAGPSPDPLVFEWLHQLYGTAETGWLSTFSVDHANGDRSVDWAPATNPAPLGDLIARRNLTGCVWLGMAVRRDRLPDGKRGGDEHCLALPGLWLDIDIAGAGHADNEKLARTLDDALALIARFPLPPTVIVHSGHGLQPHWLFDELQQVDETTKRLLASWRATWERHGTESGTHADNVYDLARVMRIPGTINRKVDPVPVTIHTVDWACRYGVDDLEQFLDEPPASRERRTGGIPYIGPARPGDDFKVRHSAGDVLSRLGFTLRATDRAGNESWLHPWSPTSDASVTVYGDDGHATVWSETVAARWPTIELRRPYDAFGLYVHAEHGGHFDQATSHLRTQGYGAPTEPAPVLADVFDRPAATSAPTPEPTPVEPLAIRWVDDLTTARPPEPAEFIEGMLRAGEFTVLGAPRAIGKTWLGYNLAAMLAAGHGRLFDQLEVRRSARVLYLQGELDEWGSATRWEMLNGTSLTDINQPLPHIAETFERLRFQVFKARRSYTGADGSAMTQEYADAQLPDRLIAAIEEHGIEVVIVDPWAVYFAGNENSNDEVEAALGRMREITQRTGVAWVILHHLSKSTEYREPEDAWRGASRLADWASTRITILPHFTETKWKEAGLTRREARRYVNVYFLRRSTPTDDFSMHLETSGWWKHWDPAQLPQRNLPPLQRLAMTLHSSGGVWPSYRAAADALGINQHTAASWIAEAERAGIVSTQVGPRSATIIQIMPVDGWQNAPWLDLEQDDQDDADTTAQSPRTTEHARSARSMRGGPKTPSDQQKQGADDDRAVEAVRGRVRGRKTAGQSTKTTERAVPPPTGEGAPTAAHHPSDPTDDPDDRWDIFAPPDHDDPPAGDRP